VSDPTPRGPLDIPRRSFLTGLTLLPTAVGCAGRVTAEPRSPSESATPAPRSTAARDPDESTTHATSGPAAVRFVGRVARTGPTGGRYAWSGSGFVAQFSGTGVALELEDDINLHTIVLDGRVLAPLVTERSRTRYDVASNLAHGEHVLEVYRRTEAMFGVSTLHGVHVEGGRLLSAPRAPAQRIEIVGDSISCGYGNEGESEACSFSAETENHYLSYGAILARSLGADLSTVAWSGRGVVKNYDGEKAEHMPALYDRTLPEEATSTWSFEEAASIVIVNLGTNDFSTAPDPTLAEFGEAYTNLLEAIREKNPDAFVLATIGPMLGSADLERCLAGIDAAVKRRNALGDTAVKRYAFATPNAKPGCDWHPSLATHRKMAAELEVVLRKHVG